ncbi:MAG: hypothetical protein P8Y20_02245 [Gammaproteobacteria bacterium]
MTVNATSKHVLTETSLPEYFRNQLHRYAEELRPKPQDDTLWYVGEMLVRFSRSDHYFDYYNGSLQNRPLALLYGDATSASSHHERCLILQRLGDMALFVGALFPERHARYGIKLDYFVGMGCAAYDYLAEQSTKNKHIYRELTQQFVKIIELIAAAASRRNKNPDEQLIRLYAAWLETQDPQIAKQLKLNGVDVEAHDGH